MNDKEKTLLRYVRNLRPVILADGHVDMTETAWLLRTICPYEDQLGPEFRDFIALLRDIRDDGVVTAEESTRLVEVMDKLLAAPSERQFSERGWREHE